MKKILSLLFWVFIIVWFVFSESSFTKCDNYYSLEQSNKDSRYDSSYSDPNHSNYYDNYQYYYNLYNNCISEQGELFDNYSDKAKESFNNGYFEDAWDLFLKAYKLWYKYDTTSKKKYNY
jgi:hypothetical protein